MVVAAAPEQLRVGFAYALPDPPRGGEVERRARHRDDLARRNQGFVHRGHEIGVKQQLVFEDIGALARRQVEVGMLRQVHRGGRVGDRPIVDQQFIVVGERIGHPRRQAPRVSLFPRRALVSETSAGAILANPGFECPEHLVEAADPSVQVVVAVVPRQFVAHAVEFEAAAGDAVGVAADDRAEVGAVPQITVEVDEAEGDIAGGSGAVRDPQGANDRPVGDDLDFESLPVAERGASDFGPAGKDTEDGLRDARRALPGGLPSSGLPRRRAAPGGERKRHCSRAGEQAEDGGRMAAPRAGAPSRVTNRSAQIPSGAPDPDLGAARQEVGRIVIGAPRIGADGTRGQISAPRMPAERPRVAKLVGGKALPPSRRRPIRTAEPRTPEIGRYSPMTLRPVVDYFGGILT